MALPQRLGCVGWLVFGALVLLAPPTGLAWWFMSEGDLDAVLDGPAPGGTGRPPLPPPSRRPPVNLDAALGALYADVRSGLLAGPLKAPTPTLEELAQESDVPSAVVARVHRAVAPARATGLGLHQLLDDRALPAVERAVLRALAVRIMRDPPAALPGLAEDAVALATLAEPWTFDDQERLADRAGLLAAALTRRLTALGPAQAAPLARTVHTLRDHLWRTRAAPAASDVADYRATEASRTLLRELVAGGWPDLGPRLLAAWDRRRWRAVTLRLPRDIWWAYAGAATPADLQTRVGATLSAHHLSPDLLTHGAVARTLSELDVLCAALGALAADAPAASTER